MPSDRRSLIKILPLYWFATYDALNPYLGYPSWFNHISNWIVQFTVDGKSLLCIDPIGPEKPSYLMEGENTMFSIKKLNIKMLSRRDESYE